ncbi:MAG: hypothetical protein WAL98_16120 [Desulfatiglandaceae bacterium]|jgi:glyoxylase-like metal-dependent hydrolase (beta-lactamase superfamily II)
MSNFNRIEIPIPFPVKAVNIYLIEDSVPTLRRTEALPVNTVLPGHGQVFSHPERRIAKIREHHTLRREEILRILRSAPDAGKGMTLFEITMTVFPQLKAWDIFLGMSETVGHLEILEDKGLIQTRVTDTLRIYEAAR